jgi:hypothetical protein
MSTPRLLLVALPIMISGWIDQTRDDIPSRSTAAANTGRKTYRGRACNCPTKEVLSVCNLPLLIFSTKLPKEACTAYGHESKRTLTIRERACARQSGNIPHKPPPRKLRKIQQGDTAMASERIDHKSAVVENRTSGDDSSSFSAMSSPPNSESEESDGTQSSESEGV